MLTVVHLIWVVWVINKLEVRDYMYERDPVHICERDFLFLVFSVKLCVTILN